MLLAAVMLKMATYGLIRIVIPMVPDGLEHYKNWAIGLSVLSIVYASAMALVQKNYKLLIAYSSIAHVGLISAGVLANNVQGIQGGLVEMFSHGILAIALFYIYDILESRFGHDQMKSMGGLRETNPLFAFLFFTIVMGSVALPLTSGFVGEFLLIAGLAQHNMIYAAVAGLTVILGAVYMLRAFQVMMLGPANATSSRFSALSTKEITILTVLIIIVIAVGVYPKPLLQLTEGTVQNLLNR
jgi:NADH-quinone oxidoreductase subunit M